MNNTFAKFLKTEEIVLKYAKGMRDVYERDIHYFYEIFFLIEGDIEFITDSGKHKLDPFTAIIIPKETYHQFVLYSSEENYVRLILNFDDVREIDDLLKIKMDKVLFIKSKKITSLFLETKNLIEKPLTELENKILLKSLLAQIIVSINKTDYDLSNETDELNPITQKIIRYIINNIGDDLSLSTIAKSLFMSESYISHIFKQDMKIPIHKYILQKRLILANRKICEGIPAIKAAEECGFKDYSVFYRRYKAMFDVTPSKKLRK